MDEVAILTMPMMSGLFRVMFRRIIAWLWSDADLRYSLRTSDKVETR